MVTDQEISQALQTLIREASVNGGGVTSLKGVVKELESKLGYDLSHKADFIGAQIQLLFRSHPTQPQQQQHHHHHQQHQQQQQQQAQLNDRFTPHQNPNFQPSPSAFQTFPFQAPPPLAPSKAEAAVADDVVSPSERPKERFVLSLSKFWKLFRVVRFWLFIEQMGLLYLVNLGF